jgi:hypothetical protein
MHWCGRAATRVAVRAELHYSVAADVHGIAQSVQTKEFVVVHLPEKSCVDLSEQHCYDAGSDAGCFWCERARSCVHSIEGFEDAVEQCSALPKPAPLPISDQYSSVHCTGGLQTWPLAAPVSNRNRICMMRNACIVDGQVTLFLPPLATAGVFADSMSSINSARGLAHYDGWSSLTEIHHDLKFNDGDSAGFIPQVSLPPPASKIS